MYFEREQVVVLWILLELSRYLIPIYVVPDLTVILHMALRLPPIPILATPSSTMVSHSALRSSLTPELLLDHEFGVVAIGQEGIAHLF